jgi:hypothetical protein
MRMSGDDRCVMVFVKRPVPGEVKTRLSIELGTEEAADLYRCFVEDALAIVDGIGVPVIVCVHPPGSMDDIAAWLGKDRVYRPQQGDDLGARMADAFRTAFDEGYERVVLVGSDSPDLEQALVREAFDALDGYDSVIGPAQDGGYYLIGFSHKGFTADVFVDIPWSTFEVLGCTLDALAQARRTLHFLPPWGDVDTIADVRALVRRNRHTSFSSSRTMKYLDERPDLLSE